MRNPLPSKSGQFVPIASMVMFTAVVFMVAAVNVMKVAHAKLKVQNIADAVALDIAAREASSLNWVADRNEWLNHLYANQAAPADPNNPCVNIAHSRLLPGLSCVEYVGEGQSYRFTSIVGATAYARLVKSVNDSQTLAKTAFNSFIGAQGPTGQRALEDILRQDIQDFEDPTMRIITWNSGGGESQALSAAQSIKNNPSGSSTGSSRIVNPIGMNELKFAMHDVKVSYEMKNGLGVVTGHQEATFGQLLGLTPDQKVGWMTLSHDSPSFHVKVNGTQTQTRMGAGAIVIKTVTVLGQTIAVSAKSVAYVVPGSGKLPQDDFTNPNPSHPLFKPTFWVKLVAPNG